MIVGYFNTSSEFSENTESLTFQCTIFEMLAFEKKVTIVCWCVRGRCEGGGVLVFWYQTISNKNRSKVTLRKARCSFTLLKMKSSSLAK